MLITNGSTTFPRIREAAQTPRTVTVSFPSPVTRATAMLTGFNVQFSPQGGDHHLGDAVAVADGAPVADRRAAQRVGADAVADMNAGIAYLESQTDYNGNTADYARDEGDDRSEARLVLGVRLWF